MTCTCARHVLRVRYYSDRGNFFGAKTEIFGRAHMKSVRMTRWLLAMVSPDLETKKKLIMNIKRVFGYICFYMLADVCRRVRENDFLVIHRYGRTIQNSSLAQILFSSLRPKNLHNLTVLFFFVQAAFFRRALDGLIMLCFFFSLFMWRSMSNGTKIRTVSIAVPSFFFNVLGILPSANYQYIVVRVRTIKIVRLQK